MAQAVIILLDTGNGDIKKSWEKVRELAADETNDPELAGFWLRWCRDEAEISRREAVLHPLDIAI